MEAYEKIDFYSRKKTMNSMKWKKLGALLTLISSPNF